MGPFSHSLINFLRSSPLSACVLASALQVFILFCCAVGSAATAGRAMAAKVRASKEANFFMRVFQGVGENGAFPPRGGPVAVRTL